MSGAHTVTLTTYQIPQHTHTASVSGTTGQGGGTATLMGVNAGGSASPAGNYLGVDDSGSGAATYAAGGTGTPVAMNSGSLSGGSTTLSPPTVAVATSGASQPHDNSMPSLALNYIICVQGIFPSRN